MREQMRELREAKDRALREQKERERAEVEPSETILVQGIPEEGVTEERLEAVAWEAAVQAGCSMPNGVHFAYDRATQKFRGFAVVEFPHKEAAKMFKEHTKGLLEVDGFNLSLKYHHPSTEVSRSRSRSRGGFGSFRDRDEPSVTIIVKGIASTTSEAVLAGTFQPFATIKDIRHFPRRGFAFVQFHSVEEAGTALSRFERDCRSRLDGHRVTAHFAKEREDGRFTNVERSFLQKQAFASAEAAAAAAEMEQLASRQVQHENTTKALSGVNAEMWASYMQSLAQTETVQSSNTFQFDKDSGFYLDKKASLYYDPNTTYFFTTDYKKYFVYDHEEEMLCHVSSEGQKVPGGERRPLPTQKKPGAEKDSKAPAKRRSSREGDRDAERGQHRDRERERERERERDERPERRAEPRREARGERPRSKSRGRERSRSREQRGGGRDRADRDRGERDRVEREQGAPPRARREPPREPSPVHDGVHKPIYFPGGDPLAKLAPVAAPPEPPAPPPKKKKKATEEVLGLASMPAGALCVPGPVKRVTPGPVTVFTPASGSSSPPAAPPPLGPVTVMQPPPAPRLAALQPDPWGSGAGHLGGAALLGGGAVAGAVGDWICEICMRKFSSQEGLQRHEQLSDLHKQNLAKLQDAI